MSKRAFADTNLFIRLITKDDPQQLDAVLSLFRHASSGKIALVTNVTVIAEIVWVLERKEADRTMIREAVGAILNTPGVEVDSAHLVTQAIDLYVTKNIDFVDAYNIFWMQENGLKTVCTFDYRHFSRVSGINVNVPGQPAS
ncbi:MAG: PIN domain-containing protein [Anaerolineae bacterium]